MKNKNTKYAVLLMAICAFQHYLFSFLIILLIKVFITYLIANNYGVLFLLF